MIRFSAPGAYLLLIPQEREHSLFEKPNVRSKTLTFKKKKIKTIT